MLRMVADMYAAARMSRGSQNNERDKREDIGHHNYPKNFFHDMRLCRILSVGSADYLKISGV